MTLEIILGFFGLLATVSTVWTAWLHFIFNRIHNTQDSLKSDNDTSHKLMWAAINKLTDDHSNYREHVANTYAKQVEVDKKLTEVLEKIGDKLSHNIELLTQRLTHLEQHVGNTERSVQGVNQSLPAVLQTLNQVNTLIMEMQKAGVRA